MRLLKRVFIGLLIVTLLIPSFVFANDGIDNFKFSKEFNLNVGETKGYLIYSDDRNNMPNVRLEDPNIGSTRIVNAGDSRGYYCEITVKQAGTTKLIAEQNGKTIEAIVSVAPITYEFSKALQMTQGETSGFLIYSNNRNIEPKVYTSDASVAEVRMVNSKDERGYYCEIKAIKPGKVTLSVEGGGTVKSTEVLIEKDVISFSKDFNLASGKIQGFLLYSKNRNETPKIYTTDSNIATVRIVNANDPRGYYCEIIPGKPGKTEIVAEMSGMKITKEVTVQNFLVDFSKELSFVPGTESGFLIYPSSKSDDVKIYVEDNSIAEIYKINKDDSRGYYCEIRAKNGGMTSIVVSQNGFTVKKPLTVKKPNLSVNKPLNLVAGAEYGFLVNSDIGNTPPTVRVKDDSIAGVKLVNANDSRGYYCEITGTKAGITDLVVSQYGTEISTKIEVVKFSRGINEVKGGTYGFIVYTADKDTIPSMYTEDGSVATAQIINADDSRGYYCEVSGLKAGTTNVIFERNGVVYKQRVTFREKSIVNGIDVSVYNGTIDWNRVKASGIDFAFVRVGGRYGRTGNIYMDSTFDTNMRGASAAGVETGVYFFTQAISEQEAIEEANIACDRASKYNVKYPIVIDTESLSDGSGESRHNLLSKQERTEVVKAFCEQVKRRGYKPMIYANVSWLNNQLDMQTLAAYDVWVAHFNPVCGYTGKYVCWQYTSTGRVDGISGNVDKNYWYN